MLKSPFLVLLLFCTAAVFGQAETDLSGVWTGTLYQNEGGIADRLELFFDVEQIGPALKGKAYVRLGDLYAEMKLSGYRDGSGGWHINESRILRSDKAGMAVSWCMKAYELRLVYQAGEWVLSGPWWGQSEYGPCVPGSIVLRRKAEVAQLLFLGRKYAVDIQAHRHVHHRDHSLHRRLAVRRDKHAVVACRATA